MFNITWKKAFAGLAGSLIALSIIVPAATEARNINVRGRVTNFGTKDPVPGVTIRDKASGRLIGTTNMDGNFTVTVDDMGKLIFSSIGNETTEIDVNGQHQLEVGLMPKHTELEEFVVKAKGKGKSLSIGKAELDVKGNYVILRKFVPIKHKLFRSGNRIILQPAIYNVSRRVLTYLRPTVFDDKRYAITQERMYDWHNELDPLMRFRSIKKTGGRKDDVVLIHDSLYVDNPHQDFMCFVFASLEDYNRITYADTFMIARGTINPLRFLNYTLKGVGLNDEMWLPQPDVELRDSKGDMNLTFNVGKTDLDPTIGNNASEVERMLADLKAIENNPDMTLKGFTISGTASPEGNYDRNMALAEGRMKSAISYVTHSLSPGMMRNVKTQANASVAKWEELIPMLKADGLESEADDIKRITDAERGIEAQNRKIKKLPFYRTIADTYLPRLRRVSYEVNYQHYRPLNDDEIDAIYKKNPAELSKYNFWKYYKGAPDNKTREEIMRKALQVHPDFLAAATDLSELLIADNRPDESVLAPFFKDPKNYEKMPEAARYNMAVSAMSAAHYTFADSLMETLPDIEDFHKGKIYCSAINGNYEDVVDEISQDSPLNEVLLLLALKDNVTALEKANALGDSAVENYVKAVCANRNDDYMSAINYLTRAVTYDPSLLDTAKVDGDLTDLVEDLNNPDNEKE